jgi:tRNA dimethylallyltransferase
MKKRVIFIVGPTAAGKSEAAIILAKKINGDIISCDSMQVYKGMDILTSKPPKRLRKHIKHYLIDEIDPGKDFDAFQYRKLALKAINQIIAKGRVPVFVGGTGLYVSSLINGLFESGTRDAKIVKKLYSQAEKYGSMKLYKKLMNADPDAAVKIHPNDLKRIIRALEVLETTGKPISLLQRQRSGLCKDYDIKVFCINPDRRVLYERISSRVERMFDQGIIKEVKNLLKKRLNRNASYAIGIKEVKGYIKGEYPLEEAKARIKLNTRHYAKRQLTWFRKDPRIEWINIKGSETPKEIAKNLWKELS